MYIDSLSLSLQGSTLCRVYANPVLPEAVALQNSIGSSLILPNCSNKNYNQSLLSLTIMSSMYIVSVVPNQPWWYLACKIPTCNKRTKPQGDAYKCSNPKCSGTDAGPRYRLAILVTDPADMPDETCNCGDGLFWATS